jgi:O-antigen ligase
MEILLALCLGLLLSRDLRLPGGSSRRWRLLAALLAGMSAWGVLLSKSRGGGLTLLVLGAAAVVWGFCQWPPRLRWTFRGTALALILLAATVLWQADTPYMHRFKRYFGSNPGAAATAAERWAAARTALQRTSRYRMITGALRAWRSAPWLGIGPGMHQNLWFRFDDSGDGNRETGRRPTFPPPNNIIHSYEVHSDWVQLLEEYGVAGFLLFLLPFGTLCGLFGLGVRDEMRLRARHDWHGAGRAGFALLLGGGLAFVAMVFHSLGDFNLQMPATTWLLAALVSIALGVVLSGDSAGERT